MKILVGKLKDLWPELTVPMSIPKKIDESKEKLLGNLKTYRSIDNNNNSSTAPLAGGESGSNQEIRSHNSNEGSRRDSEDDDDEGITYKKCVREESFH